MSNDRTNTIQQSGSRWYVDPVTRVKLPGVTSILGNLPKGFLGPWNAKLAAEWAVNNVHIVADLATRDPKSAVELIKGAARRYTTSRADIGTAAHEMFEAMATGQELDEIPDEMQPYYRHFSEFLAKWQPTVVDQEFTVWDEDIGYAGSSDACMDIQGDRVYVDYKTSKDVHPETALQLAAYRHAAQILRSDGTKTPNWHSTAGAILHVTERGWDLYPVACGAREMDMFTHLMAVHAWETDWKRTVIGRPLTHPKEK